jgi:hypothetical protein
MFRGRNQFMLIATAVVTVAGLASCHHDVDRIRLTTSDNGRTFMVRVGDTFDIALEVPVGPAYYGTPVISSEAIRYLGEFDELPSPPSNPGGGKTQRYEFDAVAVGEAEINIRRDLPVPDPPTFGITVRVY